MSALIRAVYLLKRFPLGSPRFSSVRAGKHSVKTSKQASIRLAFYTTQISTRITPHHGRTIKGSAIKETETLLSSNAIFIVAPHAGHCIPGNYKRL